ncbi:hypothetical protein KCV03_g254, partial [Aureobasidium melanogenum]
MASLPIFRSDQVSCRIKSGSLRLVLSVPRLCSSFSPLAFHLRFFRDFRTDLLGHGNLNHDMLPCRLRDGRPQITPVSLEELLEKSSYDVLESWAFFRDNASTPSAKRHNLSPDTFDPGTEIQDTPAIQVVRPHLTEQRETSNAAILAEIRQLQQGLDEIRRPQYPYSSLHSKQVCYANSLPRQPENIPERPAQDSQQPSASSDRQINSNDRSAAELPRCWDPCCHGRTFSNNSNLARHQREKRGGSAKLKCSMCGTEFSRSSARNAHEAEKRCRNVSQATSETRWLNRRMWLSRSG